MRARLCFVLALLLPAGLYAQTPEWVVYDVSNSGLPGNQVHAVAVDDRDVAWIGTADGLARLDGSGWTVYDTTDARLPGLYVTAVAPDGAGGVWVGTIGGLAHFDGTRWQRYTPADSGLPDPNVRCVVRDGEERVWVCTEGGLVLIEDGEWFVIDLGLSIHAVAVEPGGMVWAGAFHHDSFQGVLCQFDGRAWMYHTLGRRELPSSFPDALAVDAQGALWMGTHGTTGGALVRVAPEGWTVYRHTGAGLPNSGIRAVALEGDVKWIGTGAGLVSYDGAAWRTFDTRNAGLPDDVVLAVAVDARGNKWVGTLAGGVAVYREGGVVTSRTPPGGVVPARAELFQNYPNPFNPTTRIRYRLGAPGDVSLRVYDLLGREVAVLVDGPRPAGDHEAAFDAAGLAGGVYVYRLHAAGRVETAAMTLLR